MRSTTIAIVGFGCLILIFTFVAYVQVALLFLATIVCVPIILGFLWQGHKSRSFWISAGTKAEANDPAVRQDMALQIEGRTFLVSDLPSRLEFSLRSRNLYVLAAIGCVALGAVLVCIFSTGSLTTHVDPDSAQYYRFYFLSYFMVILLALAWLSECAFIRAPGITLANVAKRQKGGLGTLWVAYQFTDPRGRYYGGSGADFGGSKNDQLKVVLFDRNNPNLNKVSCGFLFHEVIWSTQ